MKCAYCMTEFSQKIDICPECGFNQHDKPSLWWNLYGLVFPPFCWIYVTQKWKKPKSPKLRCARFIAYGAALNIVWYLFVGWNDPLWDSVSQVFMNAFGENVFAAIIYGVLFTFFSFLVVPTLWIILASWLFSPKRQYKPGMEFFYT